MSIANELQATRLALIDNINLVFDRLLLSLDGDAPVLAEHVLPLSTDSAAFRGPKPIAVLFGNERVAASTWRGVFSTILARCNQSPPHHTALMELRGRTAGKSRVFLSQSPGHMKRPVRIDSELYAETHYGSETLIPILCQRILAPVRFDYSGIKIVVAAR